MLKSMVVHRAERSARLFWRRPGALAWLATSVLIPLLLLSLAALYDHDAIVNRARDRVQATAEGLAENAHIVLETAALTLNLQLNAVREMNWAQIGSSPAVHDFLAGLTRELPQLESAFFVDPEGRNSASSRRFPMPPFNVRDRDYYQALLRGEDGLYVSAPLHGMLDGSEGVVVSQARIIGGRPDGLAAVTLSPAYFGTFYRTILEGAGGGSAALVRSDGTVLFRYPSVPGLAARVSPSSVTMALLRAGKETAIFTDRSRIDGAPKLIAFRKVAGEDVVAVFGLSWSGILAEWYRHLAIFAAFALVAAGALLLAGMRAIRQAERDEMNLRALLDETERRQLAEAALQESAKMEALGRLTGGVAHDFNNLLAAVLGSLELARRRIKDPQIANVLSVAEQAARRGAKLTAQMLSFARKRAVEPQAVAVNALIEGADELLRRTAGSLARLEFSLDPAIGSVMADPVQLELALLNLVANARDAMPQGGAVTIATSRVLSDGVAPAKLGDRKLVAIAVVDNGAGMPEEVRARVFEPFFTTKAPGQGTGLGLSMVYGFARQMGGTVTVDSFPGGGTTVRIWLPETEQASAPEEADATTPPSGGRLLRILLVDDDPMVRTSALGMLRELGHRVATAADGQKALALLRSEGPFDVLLADFAMPGMNGGELAEEALKLQPELSVVFVSGYVENDALAGWTGRGFRTVAKPFTMADLAAALDEVEARRAGKAAPVRPEPAGVPS